jgi:hypothetical protein
VTPYEFAQDIRDDLQPPIWTNLPQPVLPQVGDIIVDCEGTWVSVINVDEQDVFELGPGCEQMVEMADIQIIAAIECSMTGDDDGLTDPVLLADVSTRLDAVGVTLTKFARDLVKSGVAEDTFNGIQYQNTGNLGIVTVTLSAPVP